MPLMVIMVMPVFGEAGYRSMGVCSSGVSRESRDWRIPGKEFKGGMLAKGEAVLQVHAGTGGREMWLEDCKKPSRGSISRGAGG